MSVVVIPEWLNAAASDVAGVGAAVGAANTAAMGPTTGLLAAAEDEVSAAVAVLFSTHGLGYQVLSAQVSAFHEQFVHALAGASGAYLAAEAAPHRCTGGSKAFWMRSTPPPRCCWGVP
ncbi:hypothetical protein AO501_07940 [Mycobacterium gordonae]|uniref:PE domain-containing protein n=1 Tax=Mycobacterium gordonae TaxID=1778 RepID=A0A0Q2XH22_MYCGO|nr:PE family protein [Mycobacterium gordonae]KQH80508.1 hypothetical protein AO501_07940 [Mycobacterium gordonae]